MCYNVKAKTSTQELAKIHAATLKELEAKSFISYEIVSGFAHPKLPVITSEEPTQILLMEWGLVPSWVKSEHAAMDIQNHTLNARAESLFEKPSFRSIMKKRCLILVDGFYEWMQQAGKKIPHFIRLKDEKPFALGGLYDEWINTETGEIFKGFSIITLDANPLMAAIHNTKKRMPLILGQEKEKEWISPDLNEAGIKSLIRQYPDSDMYSEVYKQKSPDITPRLF